MVCVKEVAPDHFVRAFSAHLKKSGKLRVPEWVSIVKTGIHKESAPISPDWYYTRCAAVLRRIYMRGNCGIGRICKMYGGRKRRGTAPSHFCKSSGSVARKVLQSLEDLKLIIKDDAGGRKMTIQGRRDADRIANKVSIKSKKMRKRNK